MAVLEQTASDKSYRHVQTVAAVLWFVSHKMGRKVSAVRAIDTGGSQWVPEVIDLGDDDCQLDFGVAISGTAYLS